MIEYCLSNVDEETRCQLNHTEEDTHEYTCLEHCGVCHTRPFLVVDGRLQEGDDHGEILDGCRDTRENR